MKGAHTLTVESVHLKYQMTFFRNITVIQGDSATGKTTLVDMIQEYLLNGSDTGISLTCDCPCRVIAGNTWQEQLRSIDNSIVFVDEGNRFVSSVDFAHAVQKSNNYYVIVTREALDNLPYSVTEIYGIRSSGKFGSMQPVYHHAYRIYGEELTEDAYEKGSVLIEDSNAGFDFFSGIGAINDTRCISAGGAGNIFEILQKMKKTDRITVIADGAAFGSQMGRVFQIAQRQGGIRLYLPESFEWIILSSDILNDSEVREILANPAEYIESDVYFSWERFFCALLVEKSQGEWLQYTKARLNPAYLQGKCKERILTVLPGKIRRMFGA